MELVLFLNEPAILGTAFVLMALYILWQSWKSSDTPNQDVAIAGGAIVQLIVLYILFSLVIALLLHATLLLGISMWVSVLGVTFLLSLGQLQRYVQGLASRRMVTEAVIWSATMTIVASLLLRWWPW